MSQAARNIPWQQLGDGTALALSSLCTLHCLALPFITLSLPWAGWAFFETEAFHQILLFGVIPVSLVSLGLGCRRHRGWHLLGGGIAGIACLLAATQIHELELSLTLLGSAIIALAHVVNYRRCRQQACQCHG
ncbi:MAG: MerC domain-containing protein [Cellvibrionaceae bacterium]|nr:MerC domain-containing protein [Cellvibrionaceae bacterium]MCV6625820.1 MerC domain-containing protein [Cellvibrionaceae bacterium]